MESLPHLLSGVWMCLELKNSTHRAVQVVQMDPGPSVLVVVSGHLDTASTSGDEPRTCARASTSGEASKS